MPADRVELRRAGGLAVARDVGAVGGNYTLRHSYGTFGTGFWAIGGSAWYNINVTQNAEGVAPPP